MRYEPEREPSAADWLESDEQERIGAVEDHHKRARVRLPNSLLHATTHVLVENQLAMGHAGAVRAMERLRAEGLSRHDALHAIGSVAAMKIYTLIRDPTTPFEEAAYARDLDALNAKAWEEGE